MSAPPGGATTRDGITGTRGKAEIRRELTGCGCGHLEDYECSRHEPVPTLKGCGGCQSLSFEEIDYCSRRGFYCTPTACALKLMLGGAA